MSGRSPVERLASASRAARAALLDTLDDDELAALAHDWRYWARPEQLPPPGDWTIWLIMAGRGFGKTRAGAEWVRHVAEADPGARIALVGATLGEARAVMVEGDSGVLAVSPAGSRPRWQPSLGRLDWPNGAQARLFSAAEPDMLRGPQHSHAWADEIGKWEDGGGRGGGRAQATFDNLLLGLRLGARPRLVATTTPRPVALIKALLGRSGTAVTRGPTAANAANLSDAFLRDMTNHYGDSLLGRQELLGELIEERDGALWSRALIERCRGPLPKTVPAQTMERVVVGVDPAASARGDACGIVVAARDGPIAYVLADATVERASPERWARAVADAAAAWGADRVIAEANQGGAMVGAVLAAADIALPVRLVHARRGKSARAEPVAALFEAGRVVLAGSFPRLEDQLCGLMPGGGYEGPGRSPDRADALVWALTELMLGPAGEPRISRAP